MSTPPRPCLPDPLRNGRIQQIRLPREREVVLEVYHPTAGATHWLISFDNRYARLALHQGRLRANTRPGVFCQWLRSHLAGGHLVDLRLVCANVLALWVEAPRGEFCLILEINQEDSNLLLLDAQQKLLIAARHPTLPGRTLARGADYRPPLRLRELDPAQSDPKRWPATSLEAAREMEKHWLAEQRETESIEQQRQALRTVRRRIKALQKRLDQLSQDHSRAAQAEGVKREAELLSIHRHLLKTGLSTVTLPDSFEAGEGPVTLNLDPTLSPGENIQRRFLTYRKWRHSQEHIARRTRQTEAEMAAWENRLAILRDPEETSEKSALARELSTGTKKIPVKAPGASKGREKPNFMKRFSREGYEILVGRSAAENDKLTFGLGRGRDGWLHAQGTGGAHVLVRNPSSNPMPAGTLREAAWLAAYYSQRRADGIVDVDSTQRKYVTKLKGGLPGQVLFSQTRTITVNLKDPQLGKILQRLEVEKP